HQTNPLRVWHKLTQEPQLLWPKITKQEAHARGIATRAREGDGKPKLDRVIRDHEHNRNRRGRRPCGECRRRVQRGDHGNLSARELGSQPGQALVLIIGVAIVDHHVAAFEVALLGQTLSKNPDERLRQPARGKKGHHWTGGLLRARRVRPCDRRAADERYELAAPHSITSSAMASTLGGMVRPSVFAVLRLMTSSNLVGCITGRSVGFSPLRMRPA